MSRKPRLTCTKIKLIDALATPFTVVDYRFDDTITNWNALIKPNKDGQLAFFGYDPVTGTGGILRDYNGDGKADGATLFLKDNAPGDLNPDPFIIEDPIGGANYKKNPRLVYTGDGLGLTVEGPEGLGLWVRLKTNSADGKTKQPATNQQPTKRNRRTVGATRNNGPTLAKRRFISKWAKSCDSSNRATIRHPTPHRPSNLKTNQAMVTPNGGSSWSL